MSWPPGSGQQTSTPAPVIAESASYLPVTSSSSKVALIELKSVSPSSGKDAEDTDSEKDAKYLENDSHYSERNSFDLSVLISDAHSLIRFSVFNRIPSATDGRDLATAPLSDSSSDSSEDERLKSDKIGMKATEKSAGGEGSHEHVEVKVKLPPKIHNVSQEVQPEHHTVTLEYSDSD